MKKLFLFSVFIFIQVNVASAQKIEQLRLDSLLTVLKKSKTDTNRVNLLITISNAYSLINHDEEMKFAKDALIQSELMDWKMGLLKSHRNLGWIYHGESDYAKALEHFFEALKISEDLDDKKTTVKLLHNIGFLYYSKNDGATELEYLRKALQIDRSINEKRFQADEFSFAANVFWRNDKLDSSLVYNFKALKLFQELKDTNSTAECLQDIGVDFKAKKDYSTALQYYFKALPLSVSSKNKKDEANILGSIAIANNLLKKHATAIEYHQKSLQAYESIHSQNDVSRVYSNIAGVYFDVAKDSTLSPASWLSFKKYAANKTQALQQAENYSDSAIAITKVIGNKKLLLYKLEMLSKIQAMQGDYKSALQNYMSYTNIKDSVYNLENERKIAHLESSRKEEEDKRNAELAKAEEERKENIQLAFIAMFVVILVSIILLLRKKKINPTVLKILGTFSVLTVFEFISLIIHPHIEKLTNHNLSLTLMSLVGIASVIVPMHHKVEKWMKRKLVAETPLSIAAVEIESSTKKDSAEVDLKNDKE